MNLSAQFKEYLLSKSSSKATVKNYLSDVSKFIKWFEAKFNKSFTANDVTLSTIESFKEDSMKTYSAASVERSISTLRKFFTFLKIEGIITQSPFEQINQTKKAQAQDPWRIKEFKDYLYVFNASHLTIKNYVIDVKQFATWAEKVLVDTSSWEVNSTSPISRVDSRLVEEYKKRLINEAGLSPVSVNRKLSSLRRYLSWAEQEGIINSQIQVLNESKLNENIIPEIIKNEEVSSDAVGIRKYSWFPPLRLAQKAGFALTGIADAIFILPLVSAAHKIDYAFWVAKGRPVSQVDGLASKFLSPKLKDPVKIKNVKKEFYAPALISTKYFPIHRKVWHHVRNTRPEWYRRYQSYSIVRYMQAGVLVLLVSILGFAIYSNIDPNKQQPKTLAALPTAPPRVLSFQGRLTDVTDNPITTPTALRMSIYNNQSSSGSALLWQEIVTVTPDTDGIFSTLLGNNTTIPQDVFGENSALWLGVTVEQTAELAPRQQIATVAFATNSETLQGLEPITNSSNTSNVVLALNSSGNLTIGGSANPTFQATGGTFTLQGTTLVLSTTTGSNGNVQLNPNGLGKIDASKPIVNNTNNNNITTAAGAVEVNDLFAILATSSGQSAFTLNQTSTGPLISASTSGIARFTVDNAGNMTAAGTINGLTVSNGTISSGTWNATAISSTYGGTGINTSGSTGVPYISGGTWSVDANALAANHGGTGQTSYTTGDLLYASNGTTLSKLAVGTATQCLIGGTTPSWGSCSTGGTDSPFQVSSGAINPLNSTLDFLIGGQSTTSAKFSVLNVNGTRGTQTASVAGSITLDSSTATIQTTNAQTLNIGGSSTGLVNVNNTSNNPFATFDTINSRLGIGTSTPRDSVEVVGGNVFTRTSGTGSSTSIQAVANDYSSTFQAAFLQYNDSGVGGTTLGIPNADLAVIGFQNASNALIFTNGATPIAFGTGSTERMRITSDGLFGLGTTSPSSELYVTRPLSFGATGKALAIFDQIENQDILTASSSGTTRFTIQNNGNLLATGTLTGLTGLTSSGTITFSTFSTNGGLLYTNGSGLLTQLTSQGSSGDCLLSGGAGAAPSFTTCPGGGGTSYWRLGSGAISPINNTLDVLVGSNATTSAKFAVLNVNSGTPTASISANSGSNATYLTGTGILSTTNRQTLTLGGDSSTTGNIYIKPGDSASGVAGVNTTIAGGDSATNANGGTLYLYGGSEGGSGHLGGNVDIRGGSGGITGGNVLINGGVGGDSGQVWLCTVSCVSAGIIAGTGITGVTTNTINGLNINSGALSGITGYTQSSGAFALSGGGNFSVDSAAFDVTTGGAVSGITTLNASSTITFSTFSTNGGLLYTNGSGVLAQTAAGSSSQCLLGGTTPTWGSCSTGGTDSPFQVTSGAINPLNSTLDFLVGGQATTSAKFAVLNVNSGTPTASISANSGNNSTYLTGTGTLGTTAKGDLSLGVAAGGKITILGGDANGAGSGGNIVLNRAITSGGTAGGSIAITGGNGAGSGAGGDISITGGAGGSGTNGSVNINGGAAGPGTAGSVNIGTTANNTGINIGTSTSVATITIGRTSSTDLALNDANWSISGAGAASLASLNLNTGGITNAGAVSGITTLNASSTITFSTFSTNGGLLYTNGSGVLAQTAAGSSSQCLLGGTTPTWGSCSTGGTDSPFQVTSGAINPLNSTLDFLVGGQATTSAKFAVLNVNGTRGTQTASVAGSLTLDSSTASIQTTQGQTLRIGGSTTGLVQINNKSGSAFTTFDTVNSRVGIGTSAPGAALQVSGGDIYLDAGELISFSAGSNPTFHYITKDGNDFQFGSTGAGNWEFANTSTGARYVSLGISSGLLGIGTETPASALHVTRPITSAGYTATGKSLAIFDQIENQDILTASKSGTTQFVINQTGGIGIAGNANSSNYITTPSNFTVTTGGVITANTTGTINSLNINSGALSGVTGFTQASGAFAFSGGGNFSVDSAAFDVTTGGAVSGITTLNASSTITFSTFSTNGGLLYTNGSGLLTQLTSQGSSGDCLLSGGAGAAPSFSACPGGGGTSYWRLGSGALSPINNTLDVLVGSNATTSAKFAVLNVNGTGPATATVAGNMIVMAQNGAGGRLGIGTTNPQYALDVSSQARISGSSGPVGLIDSTTYALSLQNNASSTWLEILNNGGTGQGAFFGISGDDFEQWNYQGGDIIFYTDTSASSGVERLRLTNSGLLGLGTNSPISQLHVSRPLSFTATGKALAIFDQIENQDIFTASASGTTRFVINNSGFVGINTALPGSGLPSVDHYLQISSNNNIDAAIGILQASDLPGGNPALTTYRARNTVASPQIVQSADTLFQINANGYDGTDYENQAARIDFAVDGTPGANDMPGRITFSTTADGASSTTERLRLMSSGILSLGSTTGNSQLYVTRPLAWGATGKALAIFDQIENQDIFTASASGTTRFVVQNDGSVGINTNDPASSLHIYNAGANSSSVLSLDAQGTQNVQTSGINLLTLGNGASSLGTGGTLGWHFTARGNAYTNAAQQNDLIVYYWNGSAFQNVITLESSKAVFGIGTDSPISELHVTRPLSYGATGKALAIFDQIENQDIFTASASGTTRFVINNSGYVGILDSTPESALELGDNQWMTLNPLQSTSGINFYETGTKSSTEIQYGGKIYYDGNADTFYVGTRNNNVTVNAIGIARNDGDLTLVGDTITASSLATFTTAATLAMTSTTTLNLGNNATLSSNATALNIEENGGVDVNLAGTSASTGCTVTNSSGNFACAGTASFAGTGTALTLSGAATTAINISNTGVTTDINMQNGETIDNNVDGIIFLNATTASTSGNFTLSGGARSISTTANNTLTIGGSTQGRVVIDSNTFVGIGTGTSSTLTLGNNDLYVEDDAVVDGFMTIGTGADTSASWRLATSGIVSMINLSTGVGDGYMCISVATGRIRTSGSTCVTSAERFKKDITNLDYGLDEIMQLRPVSYEYKDQITHKGRKIGFIAEEMNLVVPEVVAWNEEGQIEGIDYPLLTSLLVKGVQDQQLQISSSSASIQSLNNDLSLTNSGNITIVPTVDNNFIVQNDGENINRISVFSESLSAKISTGRIEAKYLITTALDATSANISNLTTETLAIATSNITIAGQNIQDFIAGIVDQRIAQNQENGTIISPIELEDENIVAKLPEETSKLIVKNSSGSAVAEIDSDGNASISGLLTSASIKTEEASISGTLRAKKIIADEIEGLNITASTVSANYITNNYYISTPSSAFEYDENATSSGNQNFNNATGSATLGDLTAQTATFTHGLMAFGPTSFFEASIADRLFVGSQLSIANNSINVLGANLEIQPLGQGNISFMAGLIEIDTTGSLKVDGNAYFAKDVNVNGRLSANIISPISGQDLIFDFVASGSATPSDIKFRSGTDSAVLAINNRGDLRSSGSGTFAKLNINLVSEAQALTDTEEIATGSAGLSEIKANQEEITIYSPLVTEKSLIYITPKTSTPNQSVYLLRQTAENNQTSEIEGSFTVGISTPINKKVPFNWIIIN